ncbi:MAG TPA: hypothetical protein EYP87_07530 [Flavobacteriaceae bacterium]|nr:hypothetical protein [Flavobacteriaceae bacterium]
MRVNILMLFLTLLIVSCKTLAPNNKFEKTYLLHLRNIDKFVKIKDEEINLDTIFHSVKYLEKITNIKSSEFQSYDPFPCPTKKNYNQWMKWFKKNRQMISQSTD